ncbi:plasmid recombination protein, partial [Lactobacillus gasseri]|nr:plasmid recombination protein [Lactobacillus gasseri]
KKLRTQYEFIVQVGNIDDYKHDKNKKTSQIWQDSKEILENYFENFQERNPNLIPYNAVIHMDEEGAPHMHLNVVPVAHDYNAKQGLKVKPVLNKALAEEGFEISKKDNRQQWTDFQHAEAQALADEAWIYGITRKAGITNRLKDVHQYKQAMREVEDLRKQKKQVEHQLWDKRDQIDSLDRRERDYQTRSLRLQDRALELDDREDKLNQREEVLKKRERANAELDAERMAGKYREKNIAWAFMPFSRTRLSEVEKENAELRRKNKEQQKKLDTQDGMIDRYWAVANAAIKTIRLVARKLPKYAKSIWHKLGEEIQDIGGDKKFFGLEEDEKNLVNEGFDRKSREEQRKSKEELREMYRNLQDGRDL